MALTPTSLYIPSIPMLTIPLKRQKTQKFSIYQTSLYKPYHQRGKNSLWQISQFSFKIKIKSPKSFPLLHFSFFSFFFFFAIPNRGVASVKGWRVSGAGWGVCASCPAGLFFPAWPPWVDSQPRRWLPGSLTLSRPGLPSREGWVEGLAVTMGPSVPERRGRGEKVRSGMFHDGCRVWRVYLVEK